LPYNNMLRLEQLCIREYPETSVLGGRSMN